MKPLIIAVTAVLLHCIAFGATADKPPEANPADVFGGKYVSIQQEPIFQPPVKPAPKQPDMQRATENDALALASLDVATIPPQDAVYTRYLWIRDGSYEGLQCCNLAMGYISRGTVIVRGVPLPLPPVPGSKLLLLRIDLRNYAPRDKDLRELTSTFEEFRFDPRFNLLITKDTIKFAEAAGLTVPPLVQKVKKFRDVEKAEFKGMGFVKGTWKEPYEEEVAVDVLRLPALAR